MHKNNCHNYNHNCPSWPTGEMYYSSLLEELQEEGSCVSTDSWSVAVDHSFLQSQRKDVIKRQDVIYGEFTEILVQCNFYIIALMCVMVFLHYFLPSLASSNSVWLVWLVNSLLAV